MTHALACYERRRAMHRPAVFSICAALSFGCSSGGSKPPAEHWSVVFSGLPSALVSVSGTSASDVWTVGGDPGDGKGPLVLHYDGTAWTRLETGSTGDLWWVHAFAGGPVVMSGANGLVLRYDNGAFAAQPTPTTQTLFGIWGASAEDLWAVGGDGSGNGVALRYDGTTWTDLPLPVGDSLFKVWGKSASDVWLCGANATLVHWDGSALSAENAGIDAPLFTVVSDGSRFLTVGGTGMPVILENSGAGWSDVSPTDGTLGRLTGVFATADAAYASGDFGAIVREKAGSWQRVEHGLDLYQTLHSIWVDPDGNVWSAGGQVDAIPLTDGVLVHEGSDVDSSLSL